jgi:putative ABC transport system permease protein
VYLPLDQIHRDGVPLMANSQFWVVRVTGTAAGLEPAFRRALAAADATAGLGGIRPAERYVSGAWAGRAFATWLAVAFALLASGLALVGLYALLAYSVTQRRREFAVRAAVGATRARLAGLIVRQGIALVVAGAAIGLAIMVPLFGMLRAVLFEAAPGDLWLTAGVCAAVIAAGAGPAAGAARRAARTDPSVALRAD